MDSPKKHSSPKAPTGKQSRDALQRAIHSFRNVKLAAKGLADAQKSASEQFLRWSLLENNLAIQDIVFQFNELMYTWSDMQQEVGVHTLELMTQMEAVCDSYGASRPYEAKVAKLREKEEKMKVDLKRTSRWRKGGDIRLAEQRLETATRDRCLAERQLADMQAEQQAVRMLRFSSVAQRMCRAYAEAGGACRALFDAGHDVALQAPEPDANGRWRTASYNADRSRRRVEAVRLQLRALDLSGGDSAYYSSPDASHSANTTGASPFWHTPVRRTLSAEAPPSYEAARNMATAASAI